jgi:hypothetical protein
MNFTLRLLKAPVLYKQALLHLVIMSGVLVLSTEDLEKLTPDRLKGIR